MRIVIALLLLPFLSVGQEIREYIDMQLHPCIHLVYGGFFEPGLTFFEEGNEPELTHRHILTNICYANYFKDNDGVRILCVGALVRERIANPRKARRVVMAQIDYVNRFVDENPDDFAVARSPQELRDLVHNTRKTIFVHCIEGGRNLVNSQEDAQFWADQGVAFITLIHLVDWKYGGSAIRPEIGPKLINFWGLFRRQSKRGLKDKGRQAITYLANAGVMTDITHMSDQTRKDVLDFMEEKGIPPISTHDLFKPIHNMSRGMEEEHILKVYRNNGYISLSVGGPAVLPYRPREDYRAKYEALDPYCSGSIDTYKFTYEEVKGFIEGNVAAIYGDSVRLEDMTEDQLVDISIGFHSDFNGWVHHHRPRYGPDGCYPIHPDSTYEDIDIRGLAHPGLLASHWRVLEREGVDLAPLKRSAEKFTRLWEEFLERRGTFD